MRDRSASAAVSAYLAVLRTALACVIQQPSVLAEGYEPDDQARGIAFNHGRAVPLRGGVRPMALRMRQWYRLTEFPDAPRRERWQLALSTYDYSLRDPESLTELLAFHWHPETKEPGEEEERIVQYPHLHIGNAILVEPVFAKAHVPTGWIALEDVLTLLLRDLGVRPQRRDWSAILARTRQALYA